MLANAIARYHARISGPLLDRIALRIEVLAVQGAFLSLIARWNLCVPEVQGLLD